MMVSGHRLQVSSGDIGALDEGALFVDDLVDTIVRVEVGLDILEEGDRAVSTSTTVSQIVRILTRM